MEQKTRFVLVLGWLAVLKKQIGGRLLATFEGVFSCFQGQKKTSKTCLKIL
jgi:hypothetical protein